MELVKVKYGGFEVDQEIDECLYDAIYQQGRAKGIRELRDLLLDMFGAYRDSGHNFDAEKYLLEQLKE